MIGLIGAIGSSSSFSFTSPSTCKVSITVTAQTPNGSIDLNGINFMRFNQPSGTGVVSTDPQTATQSFYLGAGQQIIVTTPSSFSAFISAYEE
jgi:hypothetical protein